jgi:hypothetical protein
VAWAHKYHRRTGAWPSALSGPIPDAPGETWRAVDEALKLGLRGLRPKSSLARLLARVAYARNRTNLPRLTPEQILAWADDHHRRTGSWPTDKSGPIHSSREETWSGVALALRFGYRGLQAGLSLAQLLARERGARNRASLLPLSQAQVLVWAKEHFQRTRLLAHRALRPSQRSIRGGSDFPSRTELSTYDLQPIICNTPATQKGS